jgi:hypothetical protein
VGRLFRCSATVFLLILAMVGGAGCDTSETRVHSVDDVRATFADHGLRLSVTERNRVATILLPTRYVRVVRRTPALGTPPPAPGYEVVVFTNRRWLRNLRRHWREAGRALGGRPRLRLSQISTRHDNVFITYPAGAPKNLSRLLRILKDLWAILGWHSRTLVQRRISIRVPPSGDDGLAQ